MSKKLIFSGVMMLVLLASCGAKDEIVSTQTTNVVEEVSVGQVDEPLVLSQGFVEYDASYIGETENTVLFFHQESCSTCKTTEANLIESWVSDGLTVLKVDFDDPANNELRQKYGVTIKHTFVQVDADGNEIKTWNGSLDLADIESELVSDSEAQEEVETTTASDEAIEGAISETTELAGVYAEYDSSLLGQNDTTVLAFFADWCPSCVAADSAISGEEVPDGLSILKVDFDNSTDLRQEYGVTTQHTFIQVDADGNLIKKWVGGTTAEDILERTQ